MTKSKAVWTGPEGVINIITLIFTVTAVTVYLHRAHDIYAALILVVIFAIWAGVCIFVESNFLRSEVHPSRFYIKNILIMPAILIATAFVLDRFFS